jgi:predicted enzyme related to lactoylglutathione lyase
MKFNSILVFSENPDKLAEFYEKVFDKQPAMKEYGYTSFDLGPAWITFGPHDKIKGVNATPERVMWNFETTELQTEFNRIKSLGVKVIKEPKEDDDTGGAIATFEDPDGNYFQITKPFDEMKEQMDKN